MTTATLVPLEEYLHTSYHPDRDWVEGELKEWNMGDGPHSTAAGLAFTLPLSEVFAELDELEARSRDRD